MQDSHLSHLNTEVGWGFGPPETLAESNAHKASKAIRLHLPGNEEVQSNAVKT